MEVVQLSRIIERKLIPLSSVHRNRLELINKLEITKYRQSSALPGRVEGVQDRACCTVRMKSSVFHFLSSLSSQLASVAPLPWLLFLHRLPFLLFFFFLSFLFWCLDQTQGLTHARQALYHRATSQPSLSPSKCECWVSLLVDN
jgi:hypothetical protein